MAMKALSMSQQHQLRQVARAGDEGLAISNTNRTAGSLERMGLIERMERTKSDHVTFQWRWRLTEAGRASA